ncbi:MAG: DUF4292 domain-containing protein [Fluviicola sp.]|nr:DUF4292 domain-containing protein [Fluviicola sp.]
MRSKLFYTATLLLLLVSASCSKLSSTGLEKIPKRSNAELREVLDSLSSVEYDWFYAKIATKYHDTAMNVSFKTSVRIKKDSLLNTLITYARIPVYNTLLTKDSITMVDKRAKCVMRESLDYFRKEYAMDVEYENAEEMFFGAPIAYDKSHKYFRVNDPYSYTMCSLRKRDIKKNERKDKRQIITYYTLSEDLKSLKSQRIESPQDTSVVLIEYQQRVLVNGYFVPKKVEITIFTPQQEIKVEMDYKKIRVNKNEKIHFVVPSKYEKCK